MNVRWAVVAIAMSAACRARPATTSAVNVNQPSPKIAPQPPACVSPPEEAIAITAASADATRIRFCLGQTDECFAVDVASGEFERLRERPAPTAGDPTTPENARVETTNAELKICQSETCTTLTPKVLPNAAMIRAATNADGTIAVFLLGDAPAGKGFAEVWDVVKGKKTATFRYARGDFRCGDVSILGDIIYVAASTCGTPGARAALYTLKGRKVANVGGRDFGAFGNAFAQVDGPIWAFLEESGTKLAIQDIAKGKVLKTIDTSALFRAANAEMGNPGESAVVRMPDGKLAIIGGAPASGSVAVVDLTTGEIKIVRAPSCS